MPRYVTGMSRPVKLPAKWYIVVYNGRPHTIDRFWTQNAAMREASRVAGVELRWSKIWDVYQSKHAGHTYRIEIRYRPPKP